MHILSRTIHNAIWGGYKLHSYVKDVNTKIGHLYSVIDNDTFNNRILNGRYAERPLCEYFNDNKSKFGLGNYQRFPLIIALVDASEDLSIQVHPNAKMALKLENVNIGKNESFYFLLPPTSGTMYNGCKCKSTEEFKMKIDNNETLEAVDHLEVFANDYVYIEAGTLHSLSAGSLVYEIEENSDYTYRFYDFERKDSNGKLRELQIDKALESLNVKLKSTVKKYIENEQIVEKLYSTQLFVNKTEYTNTSKTIECVTFLKGNNVIDGFDINVGTTVILEPDETLHLNESNFIVARPKIEAK